MLRPTFPSLAPGALALGLWLASAAPANAAELYVSGDIGIASVSGDGVGVNDLAPSTDSGSSKDSEPVYGGGLGIRFPMNAALPWRMRLPGSDSEGTAFPDWPVRFEVEYLRGREAELSTPGVNAAAPYRADLESWSVMGKLRFDLPVRAPLHAVFGRLPFLDPLTIYAGGGAGLGASELDVGDGLLTGSESTQEFAWQAIAGFGYALNERVTWSVGWRYFDLGELDTRLIDSAGIDRGRYSIDVQSHEFTTSLAFSFWRLPILGGE